MRHLLSLSALLLLLASAVASTSAPPVTAAALALRHGRTLSYLASALNYASQTTTSVDEAYQELGVYIRTRDISTATLTEMEGTLRHLRSRSDSLSTTLDHAESNANDLFGMMNRRAKENQSEELRDVMVERIEAQEDAFERELRSARAAVETLDESIQRYDDILGFLQVQTTTQKLDEFIGEVHEVTREARALNQELQRAIQDGQAVIGGLQLPQ